MNESSRLPLKCRQRSAELFLPLCLLCRLQTSLRRCHRLRRQTMTAALPAAALCLLRQFLWTPQSPAAWFSVVMLTERWDTHTHNRLMALSPGLPGWASTRKVKPIWILLKQETVSDVGISWAICKSAPRSRQITTPAPHHSVFYRPDALPAAQPKASKHWRHNVETVTNNKCTFSFNACKRQWTLHNLQEKNFKNCKINLCMLSNKLYCLSFW